MKSLWIPDDSDPTKMILVQETCYVRYEDGRVLANRKISSKISSSYSTDKDTARQL